MDIIKMTVKPNTLEAIKEGFLKEYAREIRPNTQKKYCDLDEEGYVKDIDGVLQPRKYDVVQFENKHEKCAFKIEESWIELLEDENGELVTYEENGEEYYAAQIVYKIGEKVVI